MGLGPTKPFIFSLAISHSLNKIAKSTKNFFDSSLSLFFETRLFIKLNSLILFVFKTLVIEYRNAEFGVSLQYFFKTF